ncbi:MAG: putative SOS response-associated peptidase YedK [Deltaproteobacteria bacterium]|jgi:putative SOS response-associated peptidase YedK|nr:putative SOS response-associated peptidase YedK [Deltaproteobacteria bacterium]
MCGRFAMTDSEEKVMDDFQVQQSGLLLEPRYNISPSQDIPVIIQQQGLRRLETRQWGLIPFWVKVPKPMINARAETASEKPAFRQAFRKRRCLIPASGFYEWVKEDGKKQPYFICMKNKQPIAFAGIWEEWQSAEGETLRTCAILTVEANSFLQFIHHRMPVILTPASGSIWLDASGIEDHSQNLLQPFSSENMAAWRVSRKVNVPTFDNPECLEKLDDSEPGE